MEKVETVEEYFPGTKTLWERCETRGGEKHGTCEVFYKNGGIRIRTKYVEGKWHGTREEFYESGGIEIRTEYVKGEKHGTYETFYESGGIRGRTEYVKGERHGTREEFYESGGIRIRTEYVEGKKNGTYEWFHESGGIRIRTEYVEGKRHGPQKEYNPKGDLVLDIVFETGRQINIKDSLNVVNLDKIIGFLDKLPTEKFDFNEVRSECGSIACAVGWFPSIFPEVEYTSPYFRLNGMDDLIYYEMGSSILNVSKDIAFDLFSPQSKTSKLFPTLPVCGNNATPKEVSAKLKAFKELVMVA